MMDAFPEFGEPFEAVAGDGERVAGVSSGRHEDSAIVLIHGWSCSHRFWFNQFQGALVERYRLIAFDLFGHGGSAPKSSGRAYGMSETWADLVAAVMAQLGVTRPLLVGWSYGGLVAMDYVRRHTATGISGLVFVGTAAGLGYNPFARPMPEEIVSAQRFPPNDDHVWPQDFFDGLPKAPVDPVISSTLTRDIASVPPEVRYWLRTHTVINDDIAPTIEAPVLFMAGGKDRAVDMAKLNNSVRLLRNARVVFRQDWGHAPFLDDPTGFDRDLIDFADLAFHPRG